MKLVQLLDMTNRTDVLAYVLYSNTPFNLISFANSSLSLSFSFSFSFSKIAAAAAAALACLEAVVESSVTPTAEVGGADLCVSL